MFTTVHCSFKEFRAYIRFCLTLATRRSRRALNLPPTDPPLRFPPSKTVPSESLPSSQSQASPPPSPPSFHRSFSDSDTSISTNMSSFTDTPTTQTTISNTAQVKYHDGHKVAPTMLPGRVTPALLLQWEEHAIAYFDKVKTPEVEKVSAVLTCWKDPEIDNFIKMNKDRFRAPEFTFASFMADLRKRFLDPLWDNQIMRTVVNSRMGSSEPFSTFANRVIAGNNLLDGTGIHLDATALRKTLLSNMSEFLASKIDRLRTAERTRLSTIVSFEEWMAEIVALDREATSDLKRIAEMLKEDVSLKRQRTNDDAPNFFRPSPAENREPLRPSPQNFHMQPQYMGNHIGPAQYIATGANTIQAAVQSSSRFQKRCPPLTPSEISLLNNHKGCRKCRQFYVGHRVATCPNGFPDGATYVPLTEEVAFEAMRKLAVASTYTPVNPTNSISHHRSTDFQFSTPSVPSQSSSFSAAYSSFTAPPAISYSMTTPSASTPIPSAFIEEENRTSTVGDTIVPLATNTVNAILPSSYQSFVLGHGSDSSEIAEDVSPISVPHLLWKATIWNKNDEQIPVQCLLDNGAHLVLIRPETVALLHLPVHRLQEPICVSLALAQSFHTVSSFSDYVFISPSSLNNAWSSRPIRALVAPGLCTQILLGLPFLVHNKIVIDHEARTAIDKTCGFDLLNDVHIPRPIFNKMLSPKEKRLQSFRLIQKHRKLLLSELKIRCSNRLDHLESNGLFEKIKPLNVIAAVKATIESLASLEKLIELETTLKKDYSEIFQPIPHISDLPMTDLARINLKDIHKTISKRQYSIPRQYRESFAKLIQQHLNSGFIRPSSSPFASPSFIIPKADKNALPRWVCDYRQLNENTVPDNFCLPRVDDILADCGKGKIWATIDMTDSFFQTRMHNSDIHKTAVTTPFGTYEWCVMPMGFRNSPAIHQRRVTNALREYLGKICHIYLDDIIIWSDSIAEHIVNLRKVMEALRKAKLYVNEKKTKLFCYEVHFLGHKISQAGIEADDKKVVKILEWPVPKSSGDVRAFLGLVRYLNAFLPRLAFQSSILSRLTTKECDKKFPLWTNEHQEAFDRIKAIVVSRECLTVIDHSKLDTNKIFLTTDASDRATGAVLSFGPTWETARPVSFDSKTLKDAELNYATHEKELLAILHGIRKWKVDLLGSPFLVYTDHKTLLNFQTQKEMSRRQARWMEELSVYDCKFVYVKGADNTVADALSRYPVNLVSNPEIAEVNAKRPFTLYENAQPTVLDHPSPTHSPLSMIAALVDSHTPNTTRSSIIFDPEIMKKVRIAYKSDPWCQKLLSASKGMSTLINKDGLWFLDNRLIVPAGCGLREQIFRMTHDNLGHFGFFKSYENIRHSYFWPGMRKDLEQGYIPSCNECIRNKNNTSKPVGPLHPLPVPDERCNAISMDFIGPLPVDMGFDCILSITDRLNSEIRIIPTKTTLTAEELAVIFFDEWYCENGLPLEIVSDRDKLFTSKFWSHLMILTGVNHKLSTSFHPQTNGASERSNKTINQCLRFHVERNQTGWAKSLPLVRFHIMNTVNKSTGFSPFQLRFGRNPRILPPLFPPTNPLTTEDTTARDVIESIQNDVAEARDNLTISKISQAFQANKKRSTDHLYKIGDYVMLSTLNRRKQYKSTDEHRVAKFMPRFDGPFLVVDVHPEASTVSLDIPTAPNLFPTFHTAHVKLHLGNDDLKYPSRTLAKPGPIFVDNIPEYTVDRILDHKKVRGNTYKYLVRWTGYGPEDDLWIAGRDLEDVEALDLYLKNLETTSS
jgi:hypothetical protein